MRLLMILALTTLLSTTSHAQKAYTTSKDEETGAVVFKGPVTLSELREEPSFGWLKRGEANYTPDEQAIALLRNSLPEYDIVVLMGTWCDDSHSLIPRLLKTLEAVHYPMKQLSLYGVDRSKQTGGGEETKHGVTRVPTIILMKGQTEAGRITEAVRKSIEADLLQIIEHHNGSK